jgi:hypothetical protein
MVYHISMVCGVLDNGLDGKKDLAGLDLFLEWNYMDKIAMTSVCSHLPIEWRSYFGDLPSKIFGKSN